jgi:hypothetical protein
MAAKLHGALVRQTMIPNGGEAAMNRKLKKKLELHRETLRHLNTPLLAGVAGARTTGAENTDCTCPGWKPRGEGGTNTCAWCNTGGICSNDCQTGGACSVTCVTCFGCTSGC